MTSKIGRNDPCSCGSGKKYKKCCLSAPSENRKSPASSILSPKVSQPQFINTIYDVCHIYFNAATLSSPFFKTDKFTDLVNTFDERNFAGISEDNTVIIEYSPQYGMDFGLKIDKNGSLLTREQKGFKDQVLILIFVLASERLGFAEHDYPILTAARRVLATIFKLKNFEHDVVKHVGTILSLHKQGPTSASSLPSQGGATLGSLVHGEIKVLGERDGKVALIDKLKGQSQVHHLFSDGHFISWDFLPSHPYVGLVPTSNQRLEKSFSYGSETRPLLDRFLAGYTGLQSKASKNSIMPGKNGYVTSSLSNEASLKDNRLFAISDAKILTNDQIQVEIDFPNITATTKEGSILSKTSVSLHRDWFFDPETGLLVHSPSRDFDEIFPHFYSGQYFKVVKDSKGNAIWQVKLINEEKIYGNHRNFQMRCFDRLMRSYGINTVIKNARFIADTDLKSIVGIISNTSESVISWELIEKTGSAASKSFSFVPTTRQKSVLGLCLQGINSFASNRDYFESFESQLDYLVSKNEHDEDLSTHRGIGLFLLYRVSCAVVEDSTNEDLDKISQKILDEVGALYCSLLDKPKSFEKVCSKNFQVFLRKEIKSLLEDACSKTPTYLIFDNTVVALNLYQHFYRFTYGLCQSLLEQYGTGIFAKKQLRAIPLRANDRTLSPYSHSIELVIQDALQRGLYFATNKELDYDVQVLINGKPIELLSVDDFETSITMNESAGEIDWFDLHPKTFFRGQEITLTDAFKFSRGSLVEHGGRFYVVPRKNIPKLKWLDYFWNKIRTGKSGKLSYGKEDRIYKTKPSDVLNMLALKRAGIPVIGGARWKAIEATFEEICNRGSESNTSPIHLPDALDLPLKDFQRSGVQWLLDHYRLEIGGILADDMGLGKTIQSIGFLRCLDLNQELGACLVVVPSSLIFNWQREIIKFAPNLPTELFGSKTKEDQLHRWSTPGFGGVVITTYGMLTEHADFFATQQWNVVLFDEAQNLKNIKSTRTSAARALNAKIKFALTGTPMENHYGEFYSLIDLVAPAALGDYADFMKEFVSKATDSKAKALASQQIEFLRLKTKPLMLRRTKDRILSELPEKTETVMMLPFEGAQKKIYRDTAISWNTKIQELIQAKGERKGQIQMLTALLRLRQVCSHPALIPNVKFAKTSPKFEALIDAIEELKEREEPVVVFTCFKTTLVELEKLLRERGIFTLMLHGQITTAKRVEVLAEFERTAGQVVLLMTQKVGGVGLNLTKASYVFHLEPWWNPAVENQATDRVHRMGQTRAVQVYRYIMEHSVEEKIQLLKSRKSQLFDDLMNSEDIEALGSDVANAALSREDFEFLLS